MKHNRDPESKPNCKLHKVNSCGSLQSIPDLVSTFILTDLTGTSSRPKNSVRHRGLSSTVAGVSFLKPQNMLLSLSMNLQQLKKLCCWMKWQRKQKEKR